MYSVTFRQKKSLNERINEANALLINKDSKNVDKEITLKNINI